MNLSHLHSKDPRVRQNEVERYYFESPDDNTLMELISLLEDSDKGTRNSLLIILTSIENPKVAEYVVKYVSSNDILVRNLAGDILLKNGEKSVSALTNYLDSSSNDDKKFCIDLLGLIGSKISAGKIIEILNSSSDKNVILACIEALGNIASEEAVDHLKKFLLTDKLYKPTVIEAFGKIGTKNIEEFLVSIYVHEDDLTKYAIVECLGLIGTGDVLSFLLSELQTADSFMLGPLIGSIYYVKERSGINVLIDNNTANKIIFNIDEIELKYLNAVLNIVQNTSQIELLEIYVKIFGSNYELDEMIKPRLLNNLEKFIDYLPEYVEKNPKNIFELLTFLKEIMFLFNNKIKALRNTNQYSVLKELIKKLLVNKNEEYRSVACDLIFNLDTDYAVEVAEIILNDQSIWNRINLLENLSTIKKEKSHKLLLKLAKDCEEMVRERADFILGQQVVN